MTNRPACFGLTISSPNIETWSYVVDCCRVGGPASVKQEMLQFKNRIKLRNKNLGLLFGPCVIQNIEQMLELEDDIYYSMHKDTSDFKEIIREVFPEISLVGSFTDRAETIFGKKGNFNFLI